MEVLEEGMRCQTTFYPFSNGTMRRQGRREEGAWVVSCVAVEGVSTDEIDNLYKKLNLRLMEI